MARDAVALQSLMESESPRRAGKLAARKVIEDKELATMTVENGDTLAHIAVRSDILVVRKMSWNGGKYATLRELEGKDGVSVGALLDERTNELHLHWASRLMAGFGGASSPLFWLGGNTVNITLNTHILVHSSDPMTALGILISGIMIGMGISADVASKMGMQRKLMQSMRN